MIILADENMPWVSELFSPHADEIRFANGRTLTNDQLKNVDALLVRSVTQVNKGLLHDTRIKFVGTATIGTDHIDVDYLSHQGIYFASSPGCNAGSVVDYVVAAMLEASPLLNEDWQKLTVGIIGVGNVGGQLHERLSAMGVSTVLNDPVRQDAGETGFSELSEALACDVICLHTPLTFDGDHPTFKLLSDKEFQEIRPGTLMINAGRGGVVDEAALNRALKTKDLKVVMDVWEEEPDINTHLLSQLDLVTPHIAGYSLDAKLKGTFMQYQAFCNWLSESQINSLPEIQSKVSMLTIDSELSPIEALRKSVCNVYSIKDDDRNFRSAVKASDNVAREFDLLRKHYPNRREFSSQTLKVYNNKQAQLLSAVGFNLVLEV